MQIPLQITFRNLDHSDAIESKIREKTDKLERFASNITSCRVIVEAPHKHHYKGVIYHIKIDITLPGKEIVVKHHSDEHHAHEDVYVAIRDAFNAAQRQLENYSRQRRGDVKSHDVPPHGRIAHLYPNMDYGLIETSDHREVYFHRNSLVNGDFDKLEVGSTVHFVEEMGDNGPQASSVHIEGKHHVIG